MKTLALISMLLLLGACASPTAIVEGNFDCSPGQDLEIRAGLSDPSRMGEQTGQYLFLVEVANNSSGDLTVKSIRVDPRDRSRAAGDIPLQSAGKSYDETIAEGSEHVFELPATGFGSWSRSAGSQVSRVPLEFVVTVNLTNGDSYRCPFGVERP